MSYHYLGELSAEQKAALYDISPEQIRGMNTDQRIAMALQHGEQQVAKKEAFWNAVQAFATGAIPILAFLGVSQMWSKR